MLMSDTILPMVVSHTQETQHHAPSEQSGNPLLDSLLQMNGNQIASSSVYEIKDTDWMKADIVQSDVSYESYMS